MGNILVKFKWEKFGGQISVGIFWWTGFGNKKWLEESSLGNTSQKKNGFFPALLEKGGGGPGPNFLALLHHVSVPYIMTSMSYYIILFGHF